MMQHATQRTTVYCHDTMLRGWLLNIFIHQEEPAATKKKKQTNLIKRNTSRPTVTHDCIDASLSPLICRFRSCRLLLWWTEPKVRNYRRWPSNI